MSHSAAPEQNGANDLGQKSVRPDTHFYYLSYGSNLLKERIMVQIKGAEFHSIGVLENYKLAFYDHGSRWCGALATIDAHEGEEVWGCVWKVPHSFATELDLQEGGYHRLDGWGFILALTHS